MRAETAEQPVVDSARARVQVARDTDAEFVRFVASAGSYLHRTAYLLSGDAHQAEDLVQATFERTYRAWAKARAGEPRAYARRILMNLRIDGWRKDRRSGVTDDGFLPVPPAPDHAPEVAVRDELSRALRSLPARQRRVVVLRHLLDLSEAQVADELGISVGTVKSANARGLARLRAQLRASAIDAVPEFYADGHQVLQQARAAARRRRVAQGAAVAGVFALVLALLLAGPVRVPGVGPVTLPGSDWFRGVLGLDQRGLSDRSFPDPVDRVTCGATDEEAPTTPAETVAVGWGYITITTVIQARDAHVVVPCADLAVEHEVSTGNRSVADAATLGAGHSVLGWSDPEDVFDGDRFTGPSTLREFVPEGDELHVTDLAQNEQVDGLWPQGIGLARQGDRAAWFETPNTQTVGTLPWALRMLDDDGRVVTVSDSTELKVANAGAVAISDETLWWTTVATSPPRDCGQDLHAAPGGEPSSVRMNGRERVCAVASSPDGVVVAYQEGSGGPGIGAGDGGSTVFELISSVYEPDGTTPLLSLANSLLDHEAVTAVGYDDGRLAFAVGDVLSVIDVRTSVGYQVYGLSPVRAIEVSDGFVAWSSEDGPAHVLTGLDGTPSLFTLPGDHVSVGLDGDRIAWTALGGDGSSATFGRLRW